MDAGHDQPIVSRRAFLLAAGGFLGGAVALPIVVDKLLASAPAAAAAGIDLGPLTAFPTGRWTVVTFSLDPAIGTVAQRAAYVRSNGLVRGVPSFTILSSRCTHVGCPTGPNGPLAEDERVTERTQAGEISLVPTDPAGFGCPCHGSQFDLEGNRIAGPAPRALDRYAFSIANGRLVLGELFSVSRVTGTGARARIAAFPRRDPGQPVHGPESFLYPFGTGG